MSEQIKEPTAFYREYANAQEKQKRVDFPAKEVYDVVYKAMLPYLFERQLQPRHVTSVVLLVAFDIITTAMATTKYDKDTVIEGREFTYEEDMQGFIESIMVLINAMQDATGANAQLLIDRMSIFNIKSEKLDS